MVKKLKQSLCPERQGLTGKGHKETFFLIETFRVMEMFSVFFFLKILLITFRERGREGEGEGEKHQCTRDTLISCLSHRPSWGRGPQPRHVP